MSLHGPDLFLDFYGLVGIEYPVVEFLVMSGGRGVVEIMVGVPNDFVFREAHHLEEAAVGEDVFSLEILDEYEGGGIVQDGLQQRVFRSLRGRGFSLDDVGYEKNGEGDEHDRFEDRRGGRLSEQMIQKDQEGQKDQREQSHEDASARARFIGRMTGKHAYEFLNATITL